MAQHERFSLPQLQALPLSQKLILTKQRIEQWYEYWDGMVYVSFSGGKDSTVLKHIVDSMYDDVPAVFVDTGLEYPEIRQFATSQKNVELVRPKMRFDEVIKKYGYPVTSKELSRKIYYARKGSSWAKKYIDGSAEYNGERSRYAVPKRFLPLLDAPFEITPFCCDVMKKAPFREYERKTGRKPFVGVMADESEVRRHAWLRTGCNAFSGKTQKSQPMAFWTEQDVLQYIKQNKIEICSVYGEVVQQNEIEQINGQVSVFDMLNDYSSAELTTTGSQRTGCIFCGFGCHLEKEPNRFQRLKETHPRQYQYCIGGGEMVDGKWQPTKEGLGLAKVLDFINVEY